MTHCSILVCSSWWSDPSFYFCGWVVVFLILYRCSSCFILVLLPNSLNLSRSPAFISGRVWVVLYLNEIMTPKSWNTVTFLTSHEAFTGVEGTNWTYRHSLRPLILIHMSESTVSSLCWESTCSEVKFTLRSNKGIKLRPYCFTSCCVRCTCLEKFSPLLMATLRYLT